MMKRISILFVIACLFVSCQHEEDSGTRWAIVNLEVKQNDWSVSTDSNGLNRFYFCAFDMPEITPYVCSQGLVQIYYVINGTQQILPYVRHYENAEGARWTQTIDAEFADGMLTVYVTNSDFFDELPAAMNLRVVVMW